jgi:hypothetical protein
LAIGAGALAVNAFFFTPKSPRPPSEVAGSADTWPAGAGAVPATPSLEGDEGPTFLEASGYRRSREFPGRWERKVEDAGIQQISAIEREQSKWQVSANDFIAMNECAWAPHSDRLFRNRNRTGCSIETLLANSKLKERLVLLKHLVLVSMETYLRAPKPSKHSTRCAHQWLTECRAGELAFRARYALPGDPDNHPHHWTLDIGAARAITLPLKWDQRRAVVIGARNRKEGLPV